MSRRNEKTYKPNIFQRVKLSVQNRRLKNKINRIKQVHSVDITKTEKVKVKETFKSKTELKNYFDDVSKIVGRKNFRYKKLDQGFSIREEKYQKAKGLIDDINKSYKERKEKIIKNAKENLSEEVATAIERDIKQVDKKKRTRLSTGTFDDLAEIDTLKRFGRLENEEDIDKLIKGLEDSDFYDLEKRDKMYQENYIKAIMNQYGLDEKTEKLIKIIKNVDIDKFILGLYNPYSNTAILDIYDPTNAEDYIDYLIEFYSRMV